MKTADGDGDDDGWAEDCCLVMFQPRAMGGARLAIFFNVTYTDDEVVLDGN